MLLGNILLALAGIQPALALPAFRLPFSLPSSKSECSLSGMAGTMTDAGACRYTIKYAEVAERWGYSYIASTFSSSDTASLPPACPQSGNAYTSGPQSEDCLFATVYAPSSATVISNLPIFVWIHGGSFISGSASAPGIDGSAMAKEDVIVVVLQYRLGVLGFLPPSSSSSANDPNLGLLDVLNGLKAIRLSSRVIGGDASKVTIGGQSSGAGMIRALLGAPEARGLFRAAILQSDPMSYGLASPATTTSLSGSYYGLSKLRDCDSLSCLQKLPVSDLLDAQQELISFAPATFEAVPLAEVLRPVHTTITIPYDPTRALFSNPNNLQILPRDLPILITTTRNEGGSAIQQIFPVPVPQSNETFAAALSALVGADRAAVIASTPAYQLSEDADSLRQTLERISTDGVWRCPNRDVAGSWAAAGGKVWVGEWDDGVTYPTNRGDYCRGDGVVCHEDDLYPSFGTASSTANAKDLEEEILTRWTSFITDLDPNASFNKRDCLKGGRWIGQMAKRQLSSWNRYAGAGDVYAIGGGEVLACGAPWGAELKYDWQLWP